MADTNRPLNEDAIDRVLREALDVSPSPEFLARVRMRIANDPAPRSAWTTWMPAMVGAAVIAAAVMIAVVAPWRGAQVRSKADTTTDVRLKPDSTTDMTTRVRLKPDTTTQVRLKADTTTHTHPYVVSAFRRTVTAAEPEVLISAGESAAFRRLVAAARVGEDLSALLKRAPALEDSSEIDIPLIKIEPLVPQTNGEGVTQ